MSHISVREFSVDDSVEDLTALLHLAYAEWIAQAQKFTAIDQSAAQTRTRIAKATVLLAIQHDEWIGAVTLQQGGPALEAPYFQNPEVAIFTQFGVHPAQKGKGVGKLLFEEARKWALSKGAQELVCDTSENATHLLLMYQAWGMKIVDRIDWPTTNYQSLILSLDLTVSPPPQSNL